MKPYVVFLLALLFLLVVTLPAHGEPDASNLICTSTNSGNWSTNSIWSCGRAPTNGDDVYISAGHVITLNANRTSRNLNVAGTLLLGNSTTNRSLTITNTVSIATGGLLEPGPFAATHTLTVRGNLVNDGVLNGRPTSNRLINVTFNGTASQAITGTGVYTFNILTVNNTGTAENNLVDAQSAITLAGPANPLMLTRGVFKLSSNSIITPFTSSRTLGTNVGLWVANGTLNTGNFNITLNGLLHVTGGTLNIGTTNNNNLLNGATGRIYMEGGTVNIAGRLARINTTTSFGTFSMTNGLFNVVTLGSTSGTVPGIELSGATSNWTMSGGMIVLRRRTSQTTHDVLIAPNTFHLTGGTLQLGDGNTPANQAVMRINATVLPNLTVDGTTHGKAVQLVTTSPAVRGNIAISATASITANNLNLSLTGSWINDGMFNAGTGTVTFNNLGSQAISGAAVTPFNNLVIDSGSTTIIPASNIPTVTGSMTVNPDGALQQTQVVDSSTGMVSFLQINGDRYRGVDLTSANDLGAVTVTIDTVASGGCTEDGVTSPNYATRCYLIVPTVDQPATVRLWSPTAQLNGLNEANLNVYHFDGENWQALTANASVGNDGGSYRYAQADTPGFSEFLLGGTSAPTAITLNHFTTKAATPNWFPLTTGFALLLGAGALIKRSGKEK